MKKEQTIFKKMCIIMLTFLAVANRTWGYSHFHRSYRAGQRQNITICSFGSLSGCDWCFCWPNWICYSNEKKKEIRILKWLVGFKQSKSHIQSSKMLPGFCQALFSSNITSSKGLWQWGGMGRVLCGKKHTNTHKLFIILNQNFNFNN